MLPVCWPDHRKIGPQFDPRSVIPGGTLSDEDIAEVLCTFVPSSSDESHHQKTKKVHTQKKNIFQALYQKILDGIL